MSEAKAKYFDGKSSVSTDVIIRIADNGSVNIIGLPSTLHLGIQQLEVAARVGNTPRSIYLPGGEKLEVFDNDYVDRFLINRDNNQLLHYVHLLESHWYYVLAAFLLTAGFSWWFLYYGVPELASYAASSLPKKTDELLGYGTLEVMDKSFFSDSHIPQKEQQRLRVIFSDMVKSDNRYYRLEFRQSETIGANAFALPSGIVVVTDDLVTIVENDQQLVAILAHEVGHVVHRHALRTVLQNSAVSLLIAALVGDIASTSSIAAALPTLLIHAKYSKKFETEADDFSYDYLVRNNIDPQHFADVLLLLEQHSGDKKQSAFFSTHPATSERIKHFSSRHRQL